MFNLSAIYFDKFLASLFCSDFWCSAGVSYSLSLNSSKSSKAPDCSESKSLCSVFVTTLIKTSTVALSSSLHNWVNYLYLFGSISYTFDNIVPFSSVEIGSVMPNSFSFFAIVSYLALSDDILTLMSPLAILYLFWSNFMHYKACFLAGWSVLTAKWMSLRACLMFSKVNLLLVVGWTHFSTMTLMISPVMLVCWSYLSLSEIWSSPLSRMISMISFLVLLGKNLFRSAFLATVPCEAFS